MTNANPVSIAMNAAQPRAGGQRSGVLAAASAGAQVPSMFASVLAGTGTAGASSAAATGGMAAIAGAAQVAGGDLAVAAGNKVQPRSAPGAGVIGGGDPSRPAMPEAGVAADGNADDGATLASQALAGALAASGQPQQQQQDRANIWSFAGLSTGGVAATGRAQAAASDGEASKAAGGTATPGAGIAAGASARPAEGALSLQAAGTAFANTTLPGAASVPDAASALPATGAATVKAPAVPADAEAGAVAETTRVVAGAQAGKAGGDPAAEITKVATRDGNSIVSNMMPVAGEETGDISAVAARLTDMAARPAREKGTGADARLMPLPVTAKATETASTASPGGLAAPGGDAADAASDAAPTVVPLRPAGGPAATEAAAGPARSPADPAINPDMAAPKPATASAPAPSTGTPAAVVTGGETPLATPAVDGQASGSMPASTAASKAPNGPSAPAQSDSATRADPGRVAPVQAQAIDPVISATLRAPASPAPGLAVTVEAATTDPAGLEIADGEGVEATAAKVASGSAEKADGRPAASPGDGRGVLNAGAQISGGAQSAIVPTGQEASKAADAHDALYGYGTGNDAGDGETAGKSDTARKNDTPAQVVQPPANQTAATGRSGVSAPAMAFAAAMAETGQGDAGSDELSGRSGEARLDGMRFDTASQGQIQSAQAARAASASLSHLSAAASTHLAAEVARFAGKGQTRFQIRMDPAELGRVDVDLKISRDGTVKAHLSVERRETLDMFMRDQRGLERALDAAGLKLESGDLQLSLKDQGGSGFSGFAQSNDGDQSGSGTGYRASAEQASEVDPLPVASRVSVSGSTGTLDIQI